MMPSVDKAGRQFPLALVALFAPGQTAAGAENDAAWFEAAEELALSVLTHTLDVEAFVGSVAALSVPQPVPQLSGVASSAGARWWTPGGEGVAEQGFSSAGLPPAASFTDFLTGRAEEEGA